MTKIEELLRDTQHRPFELPKGKWSYYQEWNNALFLHWKIPVEVLQKLIPKKLKLDTINGEAYVSLVAFTMQKIRPKNLPAVKFISDFDEINLRTYIDIDSKKGVYFLNIEAAKTLSVFIAKALSGLPYEKSSIQRSNRQYKSMNQLKKFHLDVNFDIKNMLTSKTELDLWLTERYCLYLDKNEKLYRYDIHHKEWNIKTVKINQLEVNYSIGELTLNGNPDLVHYSDGVEVIAWSKEKL